MGRKHRDKSSPSHAAARSKYRAAAVTGTSRLIQKRAVLRFVLVLAGLTGLFNAFFYIWLSHSSIFETYLGWNARCSAILLRSLGESASSNGTLLSTPRFSLEIKQGCDAIQPVAFFVCLILSSPVAVPFRSRFIPILIGTLALLLLNLVRLISLYYTGVYYPKAFEILHIDVWQAVFIFLPLLMWIAWAQRASRVAPTTANAPP